jgi:hypothetical protein
MTPLIVGPLSFARRIVIIPWNRELVPLAAAPSMPATAGTSFGLGRYDLAPADRGGLWVVHFEDPAVVLLDERAARSDAGPASSARLRP